MAGSVGPGGTWFALASSPLEHLFQAVVLNDEAKKEFLQDLALIMGGWGQTLVQSSSKSLPWISNVSNDGSPIEFSVAIDPTTGEAELRVVSEAQPTPRPIGDTKNTATIWKDLTSAALSLNASIAAKYSPSVSLKRFDTVQDLFIPSTPPNSNIKMAAWHSVVYSHGKGPQWKIYLDPCNAPDSVISATREAFTRLGLASAWDQVESVLDPAD